MKWKHIHSHPYTFCTISSRLRNTKLKFWTETKSIKLQNSIKFDLIWLDLIVKLFMTKQASIGVFEFNTQIVGLKCRKNGTNHRNIYRFKCNFPLPIGYPDRTCMPWNSFAKWFFLCYFGCISAISRVQLLWSADCHLSMSMSMCVLVICCVLFSLLSCFYSFSLLFGW